MSEAFRAGAASVEISPAKPELLRVTGLHGPWATANVLEGFELMADALAVEAGGRRVVFATYDAMGHRAARERAVREAVAEKTGIDEMNVLVAARHNHSSGAQPSDEDDPACVAAAEEYSEGVVAGIVGACVDALSSLRPAEMAAGTATLGEPIGLNRRAKLSYGGVIPRWGAGAITLPGERFAAAGGADSDRIDFLAVREPGSQSPFAMLTAYGTHIHLVATPYFNSELTGGVKEALRERFPGLVLSYANCTGGDLDLHGVHPQPDGDLNTQLEWYTSSFRLLGRRFADAVAAALRGASYTRPSELRQEAIVGEERPDDRRRPPTYLINAVGLGEAGVVTVPGEIFVEYIDRIRRASPFRHTLVMGFNGSGVPRGYVGTPHSYEEGGYEVGRGPAPAPDDALSLDGDQESARSGFRAGLETGDDITSDALTLLGNVAR